jgi:hypothetical protein
MPDKETLTVREATINEFADRLIRYYEKMSGRTHAMMVAFCVNEIRDELIKKEKTDEKHTV